MRRGMRKISMFLMLCMIVGLFPMPAAAEDPDTFTITPNCIYDPGSGYYSFAGLAIAGSGTVSDAKVYIADGYENGDTFNYQIPDGSGISENSAGNPRELVFTGEDDVSVYQQLLQSVTLTPHSADDEREIVIELNAGNAFFSPDTGHYYEFVSDNGVSWLSAKDAAETRMINGLEGYLAVLTSRTENDFVKDFVLPTSTSGWLGGSDDYHYINDATGSSFTSQSDTEGQWYWVTGPEIDPSREFDYEDFLPGQPDNYNGNENYLAFEPFWGQWADYESSSSPSGYFVEYGGMDEDSSTDASRAIAQLDPYTVPDLSVDKASVTTRTADSTTVKVVFKETIDASLQAGAQTATNYTLDGSLNPISAVLQENDTEVLITFDDDLSNGSHTLTISNFINWGPEALDNSISSITGYAGTIHYIDDASDLTAAVTAINAGGGAELEGYKLTEDIDMAGVSWTPIGTFGGYFDGSGQIIENLSTDDCLFNWNSGTIMDLGVNNATFTATDDGGGYFIVENSGTIRNCVFRANFVKNAYAVSINTGTIQDCASDLTFTGSGNEANWAFVKDNSASGTITACAAYGSVPSVSTFSSAFAVDNSATIASCLAVSNTTRCAEHNFIFVMNNSGTVSDCLFDRQAQLGYDDTVNGASDMKSSDLTGASPFSSGWVGTSNNYPMPNGIFNSLYSSIKDLYGLSAAPVTFYSNILDGEDASGSVFSNYTVSTRTAAGKELTWSSTYPTEFYSYDFGNTAYACFALPSGSAVPVVTLTATDENGYTKKYFVQLGSPVSSITFDSTGGTPVPNVGSSAPQMFGVSAPPNPQRTGYMFNGWYYTDTLGDTYYWYFDSPVTSNITLHAEWIPDGQSIEMTTDYNEGNPLLIQGIDTEISLPVTFSNTNLAGYYITDFSATISYNNQQFYVDTNNISNYFSAGLLNGNFFSFDNGTTTTITCQYMGVSEALTADAATLFTFKPLVKSSALAGSSVINLMNVEMTLSNGSEEVTLGTVGQPLTITDCTVYLTRDAYNSGATLAAATMPDALNNGTYTATDGFTGHVVNGASGEEMVVPVATLDVNETVGGLNNVGAIEAQITYDTSRLTYRGFTTDLTGLNPDSTFNVEENAGTMTLYKYPVGSAISFPIDYTIYIKFSLNAAYTEGSSDISVTKFEIYPLEDGVRVSDSCQDLVSLPVTQTIRYVDIKSIDSAKIYDNTVANGGQEIAASKSDNGTDTLYAVITSTEPNYDVHYTYAWYRSDENRTPATVTAIAGAISDTYTPGPADAGYYVWYTVKMIKDGTEEELVSMDSTTQVFINASRLPTVETNSLLHPDGFAVGKTISYNPTVDAYYDGYQDSHSYMVTYTWSYNNNGWEEIKSGTGEADKSLEITQEYVNKDLKFTVEVEETFNSQTVLGSDFDQVHLGAGLVTEPTVVTVSVVNPDNSQITEKVRDGQVVKALPAINDPDQIITGFSYIWYRGETPIVGATSETYTIKKQDVGQPISVKIAPVSAYYNTGAYVQFGAQTIYVNTNNMPVVTSGNTSVTENKYLEGNVITVPYKVEKYYSNSSITRIAWSVRSGDSRDASNSGIDEVMTTIEPSTLSGNFNYMIQHSDIDPLTGLAYRYIVFKIMAREQSQVGTEPYDNLAVGSTVVIVDTYTGSTVSWSYTLDYTVTDNANFIGYKVYAINTNLGPNNTVLITSDYGGENNVFYSPERGKYIVVVPNGGANPDISHFTFINSLNTPTIYYGATNQVSENTDRDLTVSDLTRPIEVWRGRDFTATNVSLLVNEVSGNGKINLIDAAQIATVLFEGGVPSAKAGRLGILSK